MHSSMNDIAPDGAQNSEGGGARFSAAPEPAKAPRA